MHTHDIGCSEMNENLLIGGVKFACYTHKFDVANKQILVYFSKFSYICEKPIMRGPYIRNPFQPTNKRIVSTADQISAPNCTNPAHQPAPNQRTKLHQQQRTKLHQHAPNCTNSSFEYLQHERTKLHQF